MAGLPGMGGPGRKGKAKGKKRTGGRSGNPAKRAEQETAPAAQRSQQGVRMPRRHRCRPSARVSGDALDPANLELPKGFEKFLGR